MKAVMTARCRALQSPRSRGLAPTRSVPQFPQGPAAHGGVRAAGAAWCWGAMVVHPSLQPPCASRDPDQPPFAR